MPVEGRQLPRPRALSRCVASSPNQRSAWLSCWLAHPSAPDAHGSRSGRSRSEPPLATFCSARVPAVADISLRQVPGRCAGYGPRPWTTGTSFFAACSRSGPSTSSRRAAVPVHRAPPRSGRRWWMVGPTSAAHRTRAGPGSSTTRETGWPTWWRHLSSSSGSGPRCMSTCRPGRYGWTPRRSAERVLTAPYTEYYRNAVFGGRHRPQSDGAGAVHRRCRLAGYRGPRRADRGLNHLGESRRGRALRSRLDSDLADVPTMYHANGKQRGTPGSSGHLTKQPDQEKMAVYQGERLVGCAHNPKVVGSSPIPATNVKNLVRGPFREIGEGLRRSGNRWRYRDLTIRRRRSAAAHSGPLNPVCEPGWVRPGR